MLADEFVAQSLHTKAARTTQIEDNIFILIRTVL